MKFSSFFSSALRTSALAVALSSVLWLTSCDDDPEPDKVLPELTVTNLADNATVWDVVSVALDVKDDRGIDKVELFVDGSLVTTLIASPYSTDWDTNSLTDGSHVVKVVATDKSGNFVEKEIPVTVKNVLVSFKVPANHLWSGSGESTRGFVFLSDNEGKLIKAVEIQNGQNVEIKAPGFKGETFYLTQAIVGIEGASNFPSLWTFAQVERGKWTILSDGEEDEVTVGQANLTFTNVTANAAYLLNGPGSYETYTEGSAATLTLKKSPATIYAARYPVMEGSLVTPAYRLIQNVVTGNNTISLSQVNIPLTKITPAAPANIPNVHVELMGSLVANDYTDVYEVSSAYKLNSTDNFVTLYKPGTAFASYYADIDMYDEKFELSRSTRNIDQLNLALPQYQGDVTFSNGKVNSSVTGSFDFISTSFEHPQNDDSEWSFIFPAGANVSLVVPVVPDILKSFDIPAVNANPDHFWLYDFEGADGYTGFKNAIRNTTYGPDELYQNGKEYTEMFVSRAVTQGRTKQNAAGRLTSSDRKFAQR
ncbi:hypothetical protein KK083_10010 [Fulvivirgaceae bacterium PWU4]|uniref:Uncharacterized protein n=1 Tax=Chryseosolibacter histidini TaxID=2782349 RepID=A0AAP2GNT7_9BACT|nr:Ig-like domain-containing protein [Chryseosolibacter histidini]MBT1697210.1 hypothetical protein [Chryseosolibacter histidini]